MTNQVYTNIAVCPTADCFWQQPKMNMLTNGPEPCPAPLMGSTLLPSFPPGLPGAGSWQGLQQVQALVMQNLSCLEIKRC